MQEGLLAAHHALEERHWWFRARRRTLPEHGMSLLPPGGRIADVGWIRAALASDRRRIEGSGVSLIAVLQNVDRS